MSGCAQDNRANRAIVVLIAHHKKPGRQPIKYSPTACSPRATIVPRVPVVPVSGSRLMRSSPGRRFLPDPLVDFAADAQSVFIRGDAPLLEFPVGTSRN